MIGRPGARDRPRRRSNGPRNSATCRGRSCACPSGSGTMGAAGTRAGGATTRVAPTWTQTIARHLHLAPYPPADGGEQGRRSDAYQQGDGIVPPEQLGPGHGGEHAGRDPDLQLGLPRGHVPEPEPPEQEPGDQESVPAEGNPDAEPETGCRPPNRPFSLSRNFCCSFETYQRMHVGGYTSMVSRDGEFRSR